MDNDALRDIAPYETFACERLTQAINSCKASLEESQKGQHGTALAPLNPILQEATTTIQYNAKWFAPDALSTMLETALDTASLSSSTTDLYAALNLIDTIGTYSLISTLTPVIRFIAYAYYQGTRSNRHKRLTQHAWMVLYHILESHLGGQVVGALLQIIGDPEGKTVKYKLNATIGVLMLTTHQMLPGRHAGQHSMQPIQLLRGLWDASMGDERIFREQMAILLGTMLQDDSITSEIYSNGGIGLCLNLIEYCVAQPLDSDARESLFAGMELRTTTFELRHLSDLAQTYVDARRRLPQPLEDQLLVPWQRYLMLDQYTAWEQRYPDMLIKLSDTELYLEELDSFIGLSVSIYFQVESTSVRSGFVDALYELIRAQTTAAAAVDVLAKGLTRIFCHKTQKEKWESQRNWLFPVLCQSAQYSMEATRLVLSIRADAAGEGYLDPAHSGDLTAGSIRPARSYNLYGLSSLSLEALVDAIHDMIVRPPKRWDVYNAVLTSLAAVIRNHVLWRDSYQQMNQLRQAICELLTADKFMDPPPETGLAKSYVAAQLIQILTAIISYHYRLPRNDIKAAIVTIIAVAGSREYTVSIHCIHALTICCYELPELMAGYMDTIINKMARMVTQRYLAIYVLEFFAGLSRFPDLQNLMRREDFKRIFGVCHSYLQSVRSTSSLERKRTPTSEQSAGMSSTSTDDMAQYVYALAHHVITFWYMALRREDRHGLKEYISTCLKYTDIDGQEHIEDQGLVTIDLMDRVDAEEQIDAPLMDVFDRSDGRVVTCHRVTGILLITTETALRTGKTIVTIRRPSGTVQQLLSTHLTHEADGPDELDKRFTASVTVENDSHDYISVFPGDITGRTYGKVAIPRPFSALGSMDILTLPEGDAAVDRAIAGFDRTSALDSHKAGVIFVGEEQTKEEQILLNTSGTPDYREFLDDLGSLRKLKGATFNTQGLDRAENMDGAYTMVWNNDVTELVYHITTFMPNDADPKLAITNKKRHIGNDFVNIVFNNSGTEFDFNTFPSAFNYVYIVISPSERTSFLQAREITCTKPKKERFYNVRVLNRPGFPGLSSAVEVKVISGASLGGYVRNLALNACVFSLMWQAGDMGDYPSSWKQRLTMIRRLHAQYKAKQAQMSL